MFLLTNNILLKIFGSVKRHARVKVSCVCVLWNALILTFPPIQFGRFQWEKCPDLPFPLHSLACCTSKDNQGEDTIFIFGGWEHGHQTHCFTPTSSKEKKWIKKADMLVPRIQGHAACEVDGRIYIIGGWNSQHGCLRFMEAYDPISNKWNKKRDMPNERDWHSSCVVDGLIYNIGGGIPLIVEVDVYNPKSNKWNASSSSVPPPLPSMRMSLSSSVVDGAIFAIGGSNLREKELNVVEIYDTRNKKWTSTQSLLPITLDAHTSVEFNGVIIVIGGKNREKNISEAVFVLDPLGMWLYQSSLPERSSHACCIAGDSVYVLGGSFAEDSTSTVWRSHITF